MPHKITTNASRDHRLKINILNVLQEQTYGYLYSTR